MRATRYRAAATTNQAKVRRHYGFGAATGSVSIGGVNLTPAQINSWSDTSITVTVPANVPTCLGPQQQLQYGGPANAGAAARCGELVRIVFRRGGRVAPDRVCAVRTAKGIVLARVRLQGESLLLLPGEGEHASAELAERLPGTIAGTQVLLIRR